MATEPFTPLQGHCTCKAITYEVLAPFIVVHCCHCTWCQRETGAAFALNGIVETSHFRLTSDAKPLRVDMPSASGGGQMMARCPKCYVAVYGDYGEDGTWTTFVRVGTLDDRSKRTVKPDVQIYTSTKMEWVDLTSEKERGVPIMQESYRRVDVWGKDALERYDVLMQKAKEAGNAG